MKRSFPSGSALPRLFKCVGGAVLAGYGHENDEATIGTAKHEALALRTKMTLDEANATFPDIARGLGVVGKEADIAEAELRAFRWMPPAGALAEVSLAMLASGAVVMTDGGHGHYDGAPDGTIFAGQIDLAWSEPEPLAQDADGHWRVPGGSTLYVADYKTGNQANVPPVERNMQVLGYSLLAARWLGHVGATVPMVIFTTRGDGEWDIGGALGEASLHRIELRVLAKLTEISEARALQMQGLPLPLVEGPHCTYCPASAHCPANTGAILRMLDLVESFGESPIPIDRLADMLAMKKRLSRAEAMIERVAKAHVATVGPIDLGDSQAWGRVQVAKTKIDGRRMLPVLVAELGDHAHVAIEGMSRAAIERAVEANHAANGIKRQKAPAVRGLMSRAFEAGIAIPTEETQHAFHRTDLASSPKSGGAATGLAVADSDL